MVFYFQKDNSFFRLCDETEGAKDATSFRDRFKLSNPSAVLSILYEASDEEVRDNGLTGKNVLIFIRDPVLQCYIESNSGKDTNYEELIKARFRSGDRIPLYMRSECQFGIFGDTHCDCERDRISDLEKLNKYGGILIYLPQEAQGYGLSYKAKELNLQVNGIDPDGLFCGELSQTDAAQKILGEKFQDKRKYQIVADILKKLGLEQCHFGVNTKSDDKINQLLNNGINCSRFDKTFKPTNCNDPDIPTSQNASEYLAHILNGNHKYERIVYETLAKIIKNRDNRTGLNERSLQTLIHIVKNNTAINVDENLKLLIDAYNDIICGEKIALRVDDGRTEGRSKFVSWIRTSEFFPTMHILYGKNVFRRLSFEQNYFFHRKRVTKETEAEAYVKFRTSEVLAIDETLEDFFQKGYKYSRRIIYDSTYSRCSEYEVGATSYRTYLEREDYNFVKKIQCVTYISEGFVDGLNFYVSRLPNQRLMLLEAYGTQDSIRNFIQKIIRVRESALRSIVSNSRIENGAFSEYNLCFANPEDTSKDESGSFEARLRR